MIFYLLLFYHYNFFVLYPLVLNKLNLTMLILNSPIVLMPITSHNMYLVYQPCLERFDPTGSLHYTPWIQYSLHGAVTSCLLFPPRCDHLRGSNSGAGNVNEEVNVDGLRKLK